MDDKLARLFNDYDRGIISRRKLLQALGVAVGAPLAAAWGTTAFGQGGCRDGYGQATGRCTMTLEQATKPIEPIFEPTGWKTVGLDHISFAAADYKKEAAFYIALMGWKLRQDDGKQAIMDMGEWGSCIFKQAAPGTFPPPAPAPAADAAPGGRGGGRGPARITMNGFSFVINPWNAKTVETELRRRGMDPIAENDGKGFESFRVKDPDGWDLQICNSNGLLKARKTAPTAKLSEPLPFEPTGWRT